MGTRNEKLKSTPTFFFPFFCFPLCCHTFKSSAKSMFPHYYFFFKESAELLTLNFNPVIWNHEKMSLPSYISKGPNLGTVH